MRYISADQEGASLKQEQFQLEWARERMLWPVPVTDPLPPERAVAALDLIARFITAINEIVKQETQAWMAEFKGALADLDKATADARAQASAAQLLTPRGAIEVEVVGLNKLDQYLAPSAREHGVFGRVRRSRHRRRHGFGPRSHQGARGGHHQHQTVVGRQGGRRRSGQDDAAESDRLVLVHAAARPRRASSSPDEARAASSW